VPEAHPLAADTRFASPGLSASGTEIPAAALFDLLLVLDTHRQEKTASTSWIG